MLRLFLLAIIILAAAIWVEPGWNEDQRTLTLRLREGDEIVSVARERARALGRRAIRAASEVTGPAPVGTGEPEAAPEGITDTDREALDRLIEKKMRENEGGARAGAD